MSLLTMLAQIPPTPTPLPPPVPRVTLPETVSIWHNTDYMIQTWNLLGDWQTVIQLIIVMILIYAGVSVVWKFFSQMTSRDAEE